MVTTVDFMHVYTAVNNSGLIFANIYKIMVKNIDSDIIM